MTWRAQSGAAEYPLSLRLADGTVLTASPSKPRFALPAAARRATATVTVTAVDALGRPGRSATLKLTRPRKR